MRVLFLDVDGVLNSDDWISRREAAIEAVGEAIRNGEPPPSKPTDLDADSRQFDPLAVLVLDEIITRSGAAIVISSTWRLLSPIPELVLLLMRKGFTHPTSVIGCTPADLGNRGNEIQAWLDTVGGVQSFAILDDDSDMGDLTPHLVKTSFQHGLLPEHVEKVLKLLGDENEAA